MSDKYFIALRDHDQILNFVYFRWKKLSQEEEHKLVIPKLIHSVRGMEIQLKREEKYSQKNCMIKN